MAVLVALATVSIAATGAAPPRDPVDTMEQFLAEAATMHAYRAVRRLEAQGGGSRGWLEARTAFTPEDGFSYEILDEGGSGYIRSRVLRTLLEEERRLIAGGATDSVAIAPSNYDFEALGIDGSGLAQVALVPKRRHKALIDGTMFLSLATGDLVRIEGRLARSPSIWIKHVDVVRSYRRIAGVLLPVALTSTAQLRLLGRSSLRMTYTYASVDDQPVSHESHEDR